MEKHPWMGKMAKDVITGFEGRVTGLSQYITGCDVFLLTPKKKKGGELIPSQWFDDNRIKLVSGKKLVLATSAAVGAGETAPTK